MGLLEKALPKKVKDEGLTKKEAEFILAKLRTATYTGNEFEIFVKVFAKIGKHIDLIKE